MTADDAEFRDFVLSRRTALVRTAYLLCGDAGHAEDLAQGALAQAYVHWGRVHRADDPDAYVRRILVNLHISRLRRKRVRETLTARLPERHAEHGRPDAAGDHSVLMAALAELPPRQRAVVVLRYWEDRPEGEVATLLGCSVGTVRSQGHRALAKLRNSPALGEFAPTASASSAASAGSTGQENDSNVRRLRRVA